ncbi:hypothetical protein FACS1894103_3640 [Campylobacterota bacterium]|nr:hypothetical protein FACS1894103_3640 [Campylobacterota bacterium]
MKNLIVIPSRYGSTRLPGKPLSDIEGKPMILRVWEQAKKAKNADEVLVATDDQRIVDVIVAAGGKAVLTRSDHANGTDRLCEVAAKFEAENYINVQGDEPFVDPIDIDKLIDILNSTPNAAVSTLYFPITAQEAQNENFVKVVFAHDKRALYFSRSPIPFARDGAAPEYYKHIGLYGYRKNALKAYPTLAASDLEKAEKLEQLRFLQNGFAIYAAQASSTAPAVDTPECLERARRFARGDVEPAATLENIKLILLDADGVLAPSTLIIDENGECCKAFDVRDGLGIELALKLGLKVGVITGRDSKSLRKRLEILKITLARFGIKDKSIACNELIGEAGVTKHETLYIGDDALDLPAFKACGIACAVGDAPSYIRQQAAIRLEHKGGNGAVREAIDMIFAAQGKAHILSTAEGYLSTI